MSLTSTHITKDNSYIGSEAVVLCVDSDADLDDASFCFYFYRFLLVNTVYSDVRTTVYIDMYYDQRHQSSNCPLGCFLCSTYSRKRMKEKIKLTLIKQ